MKQEIVELLEEVISKGKYKKTTCFLRDDTGYCINGVIYDIYRKKSNGKVRWIRSKSVNTIFRTTSRNISILPSCVIDWAGLSIIESDYLAKLNDNGSTFKEILEIIKSDAYRSRFNNTISS